MVQKNSNKNSNDIVKIPQSSHIYWMRKIPTYTLVFVAYAVKIVYDYWKINIYSYFILISILLCDVSSIYFYFYALFQMPIRTLGNALSNSYR
jgi:hypothetical protein